MKVTVAKKENYEGIRFMTAFNNIISAFAMFMGCGASLMAMQNDPLLAVGGFLGSIFLVLAGKSTIEVMSAIREMAINTRKGN